MFPLNDAILCPDCDFVFSYKDQIHPYNHYPICPICGNRHTLNLGRVLNRKEAKDETSTKHDIVGGRSVPDSKLSNTCSSGSSNSIEAEFFTGSSDEGRSSKSRREDNEGCGSGIRTNWIKRTFFTGIDMVRILIQNLRYIKQAVSRFNADSKKLASLSALTQRRGH